MRTPSFLLGSVGLLVASALVACSGEGERTAAEPEQSGTGGTVIGTGGMPAIGGSPGLTGGSSSGGSENLTLPVGYTPAALGGWKLGQELTDENPGTGGSSGGDGKNCDALVAIVRDFKRGDPGHNGHPDFETFYGPSPTLGLVEDTLGLDFKPIYSGKGELGDRPQKQMTSKANFDQWYRSDTNPDTNARVNRTYKVYLWLQPNNGVRTFQSADTGFFPINGAGFGNEAPFIINAGLPDEKTFDPQNFHFTTEVHTKFAYKGKEIFKFSGDDDLWVFVNGKLALDLGGLHPKAEGQVDLDAQATLLGISPGNEYTLDLFQAERGMPESNFRIDSTLVFTECEIIVR